MLPKNRRIPKSTFPSFQGKGRSFFVESLTVRVFPADKNEMVRASVIVSKKVAKSAVDRNRIRRRVYAVLSNHMGKVRQGYNLLVYPKADIKTTKTIVLEGQVLKIFTDIRKVTG